MIRVRGLKKQFGNGPVVLRDVNCDIEKGEVISIIGPSGTGKSTFLRCLNLLERPSAGSIEVGGVDLLKKGADVRAVRKTMGMVFQSFNLFSHLMIIENLMLGPVELLHMDRQAAYEECMHQLTAVGIADKAFAYPDELSGGQKQRAAIARCLAMKPEIVLFDEPTSALDPTMVSEVLQVIRRLAKEGLTMMIVTHEMAFARNVSSRVFYMDDGEIYEDGPPSQIFDAPQRERTRQFIYKIKRYNAAVDSRSFDLYRLNAELEQFARTHFLGEKKLAALQSVCEEMLCELLIPKLADENLRVELSVEHPEGGETTEVAFRYPGPDLRPLDDEGDLAATLVKRRAVSVESETEDGLNVVRLKIN